MEYLYILQKSGAVGLNLRGMLPLERAEQWKFPIELCLKVMTMRLERSKATFTEDRNLILNLICGSKNLQEEPPINHHAYHQLNAFLWGSFAACTYGHALEYDDDYILAAYNDKLHRAPLKKIFLDLQNCCCLGRVLGNLLKSLPITVSDLQMDFSFPVLPPDEKVLLLLAFIALQGSKSCH